MGIDLHPVAVALARVTYLLALGGERLKAPNRGTLSVPVYLGDSLGWDQHRGHLTVDMLVIPTEVGDQLFSAALRFPDHLLEDGAGFDQLVEALVRVGRPREGHQQALGRGRSVGSAISRRDLAVSMRTSRASRNSMRTTATTLVVLRPQRFASGLAEPCENRVDVLVGNPPWLSYRHMTKEMQRDSSRSRVRDFWRKETTARIRTWQACSWRGRWSDTSSRVDLGVRGAELRH